MPLINYYSGNHPRDVFDTWSFSFLLKESFRIQIGIYFQKKYLMTLFNVLYLGIPLKYVYTTSYFVLYFTY